MKKNSNYLFRVIGGASVFLGTNTLLCNAQTQPNVIIIFTDDQGYSDLGSYGSELISTPRLDELANAGMSFSNFYVSTSVSSPSRASLLTGRMNNHNGVPAVYFPDKAGMPQSEQTIAEYLKEEGYATGCFGKWHLGDLDGHLPTDQGFDEFWGIPYSNDMFLGTTHKFASNAKYNDGFTHEKAIALQKEIANERDNGAPNTTWKIGKNKGYKLPLFHNKEVIEFPINQATSTRTYFDHAIEFIKEQGKESPFFAYITPAMPHIPLYASEEFKGKSKRGLYGDVVEEIDHHVGRLMDMLKENGLEKNTIIIFSSDNGPWLSHKANGGTALPLRDGKFSLYEGGVRTPFIITYPGVIPAGKTSDNIMCSYDLFPTLMTMLDTKNTPQNRLDGIDQSKLLIGKTKKAIRDEYIYVFNGVIKGIRKDNWVYLPYSGNVKAKNQKPELFNLKKDESQQNNLYDTNKKQVKKMKELLETRINEHKLLN